MDLAKYLLVLFACLLFVNYSLSFTLNHGNWDSTELYISYEPSSSENCRLASECANLNEIIVSIDTRKEYQV